MSGDNRLAAGLVGALGPRLAGRLTAELILRSPQYMNPLKQYEIDLRGNKIAAIENLGATENQFDSIDLSDNSIVRLEGFPRLHRLKQLLINNNRIMRVTKNVHENIPNLEVLVLTNNKLTNLQDLDALAGFEKLELLSLVGNPVVAKQNYRLYVISKCKSLKILDFKKVKQQEREAAQKLFPNDEAAAELAAKTFEVDIEYEQTMAAQQKEAKAQQEAAIAAMQKGPTPDQVIAIKAAIANAATMEEIRRLEEALTTGHLPSEFQIPSSNGAVSHAQETAAGKDATQQGDGDVAMTDAGHTNGDHASKEADADKPTDMAVG